VLHKRGFTLIEIMMVLVISGLLLAIILPQFIQDPLEAKIAKTKAGLEKLRTAVDLYHADKGMYPMGFSFSTDVTPYLNEIPAEGFENSNTVVYGMDTCGTGFFGAPGGWCYMGDGRGGRIYPNFPNYDPLYGNENFGNY